jgi:hypothetical protein
MGLIRLRSRANPNAQGRRTVAVLAGLMLIPMIMPTTAPGQDTVPGRKGAAALSRYPPLGDLALYLEFDGLDAHAAAWHASAAYKLLNETKLGTLLEDLVLQGVELVQEKSPRDQRTPGAEVVGVLKQIARDGFVVGMSRRGPREVRLVAIVRHGDRPAFKRLLATADAAGPGDGAGDKPGPLTIEKAGRTFHRLGTRAAWLVENGDLILTDKRNIDEIPAQPSGDQPNPVDQPFKPQMTKAEDGFLPAAVGFIDMAALAPERDEFGLEGLKRIELQWGFQGDALLTRLRLSVPGPRTGLASLLDQPTFGIDSLPPLPANLTALSVLSVDVLKSFDQLDALVRPVSTEALNEPAELGTLARHGINLRQGVLRHLGPKLAFYAQAPRVADTKTAASLLMSHVAGFTLAAQVNDAVAAARGIDSLIKSFNPILREYLRTTPRNQYAPSLAFLKFQKLAGPHLAYALNLPDAFPRPYATTLRPTVIVDRDQLVVSASTPAAQAAVAGGGGARWQPAEAFVSLVKTLPAEMVYLGLSDPRAGTAIFTKTLPILVRQFNAELALSDRTLEIAPGEAFLRIDPDLVPAPADLNRWLFPSLVVDRQGALLTHREAIPTLASPAVWGAVAAYFLPAVESSREAARRARCRANLVQIAMGMQTYHRMNKAFPMAAIVDGRGKPLLSWRVAILPYIEQRELYDKFKRDEPWDSPHNQALLKEMPRIYLCPGRTKDEPFTTNYKVFVGAGALFEKGHDVTAASVTDGIRNTLMVVEATEAVPWTRPDDLSFDPAVPPSLAGAGSPHRGGFHAALADRSVRFLKDTIDLNVFRALITRAMGEIIDNSAF